MRKARWRYLAAIVAGSCVLAACAPALTTDSAGGATETVRAPRTAVAGEEGTAAANPSPSASSAGQPPPSSTARPDPAHGGLEVDSVAEVVTTDLVVRSLPEISDASVIDPVRVPMGFLGYIVNGPVAADGYDWFQVALFPPDLRDVVEDYPGFGWLAAAGKDGEPWIAPWDGECPERNWDGIMLLQRYITLSCWGDADVTLEGALRCDPSVESGQPVWLWTVPCRLIGADYGDLLAGGIGLYFVPELGPAPRDGARVRVTGHLDDPAAESCTLTSPPGTEPHPELVALWCRAHFVVTEATEP